MLLEVFMLCVVLGYLLMSGVIATLDHLRYGGQVGILRCFLLALSFPLFLLNMLLGFFYSFFGILYLPVAKYVTVVDGDIEATLKNMEDDLKKLDSFDKDDKTPMQ